jgi:hypothetical protein
MRFFTAIWGFWFAAAFLELPVLHACPVHGGVAAVATDEAAAGEHAHHHGAPASDAPADGKQCSCLSHCCGVSPVAIAPRTAAFETSLLDAERCTTAATVAVVTARPHERPFANGPPVA